MDKDKEGDDGQENGDERYCTALATINSDSLSVTVHTPSRKHAHALAAGVVRRPSPSGRRFRSPAGDARRRRLGEGRSRKMEREFGTGEGKHEKEKEKKRRKEKRTWVIGG